MAGAPCPVEVMKRVQHDMHMTEVLIAYGQTETSPVNHQTTTDDPLDKQVETVGRPGPHLEIKLVGEDGAVVPIGNPGEICCRGYSVMQGYWDEPARTAETIDAAGWLHSGDLGVMDAEGYTRIVGRLKDMIIRGGENVYPREVEEFLFTHPAVQEVQVFGVADSKYGEQVCAWIKLRAGHAPTDEDIRAFCKDRIAHFKVPRYVRFVDDNPDDGHRQTAEVQDARGDGKRAVDGFARGLERHCPDLFPALGCGLASVSPVRGGERVPRFPVVRIPESPRTEIKNSTCGRRKPDPQDLEPARYIEI